MQFWEILSTFDHKNVWSRSAFYQLIFNQVSYLKVCLYTCPTQSLWGSAFGLLTVPLGLLCHQMLWSICLSAQVILSIQTADRALIRVASWWMNEWVHIIKKVKKIEHQQRIGHRFVTNNNNKFRKIVFKTSGRIISFPMRSRHVIQRPHELTFRFFLAFRVRQKASQIIVFSLCFFYF